MGRIEEIAVAVIFRGDEVLVTRRPTPPLQDRNEFPGGHREPPETLEQCVVREVREETGLHVVPIELLEFRDVECAWGHLAISFFECRLENPTQFLANTAQRPRWVPIEDLRILEMPLPNRNLINTLLQRRGLRPLDPLPDSS